MAQYSPDGKWMWDGQRWVPAPPVASAPSAAGGNRGLLLIGGLMALVLVLGVCGMGVCALALSAGGSGSSSGVAGNYALQEIDGHGLPAGGSFGQLVVQGSLQLTAQGGYSIRFSWQGEFGGARYTGDDGSYTRSGGTVSFQPKDEAYRYSGQLNGSSLLVTYDWSRNGKTDRFLFSRQGDASAAAAATYSGSRSPDPDLGV